MLDSAPSIHKLSNLFDMLDDDEARVSLSIYRGLARARRVFASEVARRTGVEESTVERMLGEWPSVYRDSDGAVVGFWGLTEIALQHKLTLSTGVKYAWCSWDALFIPHILGVPAVVHSSTPIDEAPVELHVSDSAVLSLGEPASDWFVSFVFPDADRIAENVMSSFCHHVHFLSAAEAPKWKASNPQGEVLPLDDAFKARRLKNIRQFGRHLEPAPRPVPRPDS